MICPNCSGALSNKAVDCVCGWKKAAQKAAKEERPSARCAFDGCLNNATMKVRIGPKTPGKERHNWATVCSEHDLQIVQKEADDWMASVGLTRRDDETPKEWRARTIAWLKANAEKQKRVKGFANVGGLLVGRQREPGDDDEEIPA